MSTFTNTSKNTSTWDFLNRGSNSTLLLESGDNILLENGDDIILEQAEETDWTNIAKN